jgi:hypothetical protein
MQTMTQYQGLANAMLQNQQAKRQMQQQNTLTDILGRSGGVFSPQVYKDLVASGNVDAALTLQRHGASMGALGVQTQAAQTALEQARLQLGETKRGLAVDTAMRDYIAQNDDLSDPVKLRDFRRLHPDAAQKIITFNTTLAKAKYDEATSGRLTDKANLDLFRTTVETFAGPLRVADEKSFYPIYDQLAKLSPTFAQAIPREFSPANVANILKIGDDLKHTKFQTIGGVPGLIDERTNTFTPTQLGGAGAATPAPGQRADIAPPVAPVAGAPTSPMAPTVANALAQGLPGAAPAAPAANAMAAQPAAPQTMTQLLAAQKAGELDKYRQQKLIDDEIARAGGPAKAEQAGLEARARETAQIQAKTAETVRAKLPQVEDAATQMLDQLKGLIGDANVDAKGRVVVPTGGAQPHLGFESAVGTSFSKALPQFMVPYAGTERAGFDTRLAQVKGGAFLEAYNTLRGGGAISETEGAKGTAALNRMDSATSEVEFIRAARDFEKIVKTGLDRARAMAKGAGGANAPTVNFTDGQTATGPNGTKIIFRNGQWGPL